MLIHFRPLRRGFAPRPTLVTLALIHHFRPITQMVSVKHY